MYVREVMSRNVKTMDINDMIIDAIYNYRDYKISSFLIKENNECVGIVTERDLIEKTIGLDPNTTPIGNIMTRDLITISPYEKIEKAVELMKEHKIKKLPVVSNDKKLEGIITITDLGHCVPEMAYKVETFFWEWESLK